MSGLERIAGIKPVTATIFVAALIGCGTSMNPIPASSSGGLTQAQAQPALGPVLGYVLDAAGQSLRPVQGLPGASIVGNAVISAPSQSAFTASASSSVSRTALFLDANGGVFQSSLSGGKLTQVASLPGASDLLLSNSGAYALITGKSTSGTNIASVITGLPQSPAVRSLNVATAASILGGAVSDTGAISLAISSGQSSISIMAFTAQAAGVQVATAQAFGGMQFVPNSDELVVADGGTGALTAISHVNTTPVSATLSPAGAIASPVALDITPNGRWVVAANHVGGALRLDLTGATPATTLHCSCAPSQVLAMRGTTSGTTVRLVTNGGGPLWIVDAGSTAPRVLFVPAATPASTPAIVAKSKV